MADLIKKIDTPDGLLVFSLTRIHTVNGLTYFAGVFGRSAHHFFLMEKRGGKWKIVQAPKPPDWIYSYEDELGKFLEENSSA
jgi:hypothetical protein